MTAALVVPPGLVVPDLPMPAPKFSTPRTDRPTLGTRQAAFSAVWLGQPLMPWQRHVADVAGELDADGLPVHSLIVVTLPRQAGKSHLAMTTTGERCFTRPGFRAWYTAQTGGDARDQFLKFSDETLAGRPLSRAVRILRGNGHESMRFANGSTLRPHPPTEAAMHGKQSDREDIDEAWAFTADEGAALLQAVSPTQLTRPGAQTWIWSAGGTAGSTWLAELVARGRAGDPSLCFFEWGIPDDLPLDDLDAIARHHPAYGHTITLRSLHALRAGLPDDAAFARAAGNRWTEVIGGAIDSELWESVRWHDPIPDGIPVAFGAARAADGSHAVLAAAATVNGVTVAEILDVVPAPGAAGVFRDWVGYLPIAVDPSGASGVLADDLKLARANVLRPTVGDVAAACARLSDGLPIRSHRFRRHPALDSAVMVAGRRRVGVGGFVWAQTRAGASIAALEAVTVAGWNLAHTPAPSGPPVVRWSP